MVPVQTATTRDKILSAGLNLFSSKGFIATTTREIAREAGIAEVTLFRHFPSKEQLLEEVITQFSFIPALKAQLAELKDQPCEDALVTIADTLLDTLTLRKEWVLLMQAELRRNPDKLLKAYHTFLDRIFASIAEYFCSQQDKGTMGSFNAEIAARAFYGMIFNCFYTEEVLLRKQYRKTDRRVAVREFARLFVRGTASC